MLHTFLAKNEQNKENKKKYLSMFYSLSMLSLGATSSTSTAVAAGLCASQQILASIFEMIELENEKHEQKL